MRSSVWALLLAALFCIASAKLKKAQNHGDSFPSREIYRPQEYRNEAGEYVHRKSSKPGAELVLQYADDDTDANEKLDKLCQDKCGVPVNEDQDVQCRIKDEKAVCDCQDKTKTIVRERDQTTCETKENLDELCKGECGVPVNDDQEVLCRINEGKVECDCKNKTKEIVGKGDQTQCEIKEEYHALCKNKCGVPVNDDQEVECRIKDEKAVCDCKDKTKTIMGEGDKTTCETKDELDNLCKATCGVPVNEDQEVQCRINKGKEECDCKDETKGIVGVGDQTQCEIREEFQKLCKDRCGVNINEIQEVQCRIKDKKAECDCKDETKKIVGEGDKTSCEIKEEFHTLCKDKCGVNVNEDQEVQCGIKDKKPECGCKDEMKKIVGEGAKTACEIKDEFHKLCKDKCGVNVNEDQEVQCRIKDKNAECGCKDETKKVVGEGVNTKCEIKEEFHKLCKENCGVSVNTDQDVQCRINKENKAECDCKDKTKIIDGEGDKTSCKIDMCLKTCGISYGKVDDPNVECKGGPFADVTCACKDPKKLFAEVDKVCKIDKCLETCGIAYGIKDSEVQCNGGPFEDVTCACKDPKKIFDKKVCKTDKCFDECGVSSASEGDVKCEGGPFGDKITCSCRNGKNFDPSKNECRETCTNSGECEHGSECKIPKKSDKQFCDCLDGTTGDYCEIIKECTDTGKFSRCKEDKGKCVFVDGEAKCDCSDIEGKGYYDKVKHCEVICKKSNPDACKSPKVCNGDSFCACKEGYQGEDCDEVLGCDKAKCERANAECHWDGKATCKCNAKGFVFDGEKCLSKFCSEKPCKAPAICLHDETLNSSYCKCDTSASQYYNYVTKKCTVPDDKCLLLKEKCGENQVCKDGKCVCAGYYEKDDKGVCKSKFCDKNICFLDAECKADEEFCGCKKGKYYDGFACRDAVCILGDFKGNCDKCPANFERKDKTCVPKEKGVETCNKDCGYGYCVKEKVKEKEEEVCKCIKAVAELKDDTCVLKTSICASKQLTKNMKKCNCTYPYKDAEDGLTCTLITCDDKVAQEDCAKKGAICKMQWKEESRKKVGYACECPSGYTMDTEKGICTDPCSRNAAKAKCRSTKANSVCYNSQSKMNTETISCDCPPTLDGEGCSKIVKYDYLVQNIPVLKTRYDMNGKVDRVKLNGDIMDSLKQMFRPSTYRHGYLNDFIDAGGLLKSNVWIRFNVDPEGELKRFALHAQKFDNKTFEDIEIDEDLTVLPPRLLVSAKDLNNVQYKQLDFCSDFPKDSLCGKEAGCSKNKCFCKDGYKTIDSTFVSSENGPTILRCEDINECALGSDNCPGNTVCENTVGSYFCKCKPGFKKENERDKSDCTDLCTPSPCKKGSCSMVNTTFDCKCDPGYGGALCERADINYSSAKKGTVVVGAVLGTILALAVIAFLLYYWKVRKGSYSEDFTPAARQDHPAEMMERRPMRGVVNKSYE